jgi:hypothetical protein
MLASLSKALSGNLTYDQNDDAKAQDKLRALALGSIGRVRLTAEERAIRDREGGCGEDRNPGRDSHLNSLGISLIAFKHAHKPNYYVEAVRGLGHALAWRKVKNRGGVAKTAIGEWVVDVCNCCLGARQIVDERGIGRPCLECGETGTRRFRDDDVVPEAGIHRKGIPGKAMQEAHHLIALAVSVAVRGAIRRLGR